MNRLFGLLGAVCCFALCVTGCSRRSEPSHAPRANLRAVLDKPTVLATLADEEKPPEVAASTGLGLHPTAPATTPEFFFSEMGGGVAFVLQKGDQSQVVHDGSAGKPYAAVGAIALSRDGRRHAHGALASGKWRMVVDGVEGQPFSAVQAPAFSPDGAHVAFMAMAGERWHLVVDGKVNGGTTGRYQRYDFSGDSSRIAFVEESGEGGGARLFVGDLALEKATLIDGNVAYLTLNADRTRIAAVTEGEDGQRVISFAFDEPAQVRVGPVQENVYGLSFGPDGSSVTYRAARSGKGFVVLDVREAPFGADGVVDQAIRPGGKALGALVASGAAVRFHEYFADEARDEGSWDEADGLVYSADGRFHACAARRGANWLLVVNGKEGPPFDRVVSPQFSPDGKLVVYRAREGGKRFVVVADTSGKTIRRHPAYEQVFPVLFTADGKSVAYGVKDGRQLAWKVEPL